jgi:glycosyltransferase involved in cell wall biosynthesis
MDKNSSLKGRDILIELVNLIEAGKHNIKIIYLSEYNKYNETKDSFWNSIDYLLVPSILDNSPNVIHEAKSLGIPVIATNVGGISEILNPLYDYVIDLNENTPYLIVDLLNKMTNLDSKTDPKQIIKDYKNYSYNSLEKIIKVYQDIL